MTSRAVADKIHTWRNGESSVRCYRYLPSWASRPIGIMSTLAGYHPFMRRRAYLDLASLPTAERAAVMRDPSVKQSILHGDDVPPTQAGSMEALNAGDLAAGALYFDVTDLPGIGQDHDYLFRTLPSTPLHALNRALVRGEPLPDTLAGFDRHGAIYQARRN